MDYITLAALGPRELLETIRDDDELSANLLREVWRMGDDIGVVCPNALATVAGVDPRNYGHRVNDYDEGKTFPYPWRLAIARAACAVDYLEVRDEESGE